MAHKHNLEKLWKWEKFVESEATSKLFFSSCGEKKTIAEQRRDFSLK